MLSLFLYLTFFGMPFAFMVPCIWNLWSLFDGPPELKITNLEEFTHFVGRLCTTCIGGGYITHFSYDFIHSNYDYKAVFDVIFPRKNEDVQDVTTSFDQHLPDEENLKLFEGIFNICALIFMLFLKP